jgi:hypothetical protein
VIDRPWKGLSMGAGWNAISGVENIWCTYSCVDLSMHGDGGPGVPFFPSADRLGLASMW